MHNDLRILRERVAAATDVLDAQQAGGDAYCSAAMVVQTISQGSYPTTSPAMFAANPCEIDGAEIENGPASYVIDTNTVVYFWNTGSKPPAQGSRLVVHATGGRWVTRFDG